MKGISSFIAFVFIVCCAHLFAQDLNWVRQYREMPASWTGTYHEQYMKGFKYTNDGGILTYGHTQDDVDFDPGLGEQVTNVGLMGNGYIVKLDSLGAFSWIHYISGNYGSEIMDVDVDEDGYIYVTGSSRGATVFDFASSFSLGAGADWDMFVMKLDSSGTFIWAQNYGSTANPDYGYKISVSQGKICVGGIFYGTVNLDPNFTDTTLITTYQNNFVMCMDTNTMYDWINFEQSNGYEGVTVEHDDDGNLFYGYNAVNNFHLKKYDTQGSLLMHKNWGAGSDLYIEEITFDHDGGIYLAGRGYNSVFYYPTYDMDPGPNEYLFHGGIFYMRLDSNGDFYLGNEIGGTMWNGYIISSANGIAVDYQKNVYISGSFRGSVDFDPSPETIASLSTSPYTMDGFVARYDSLGNYIWVYEIGSDESDYSTFVHVDEKMNVTNSGAFNCTIDFDPGSGTSLFSANGCDDWFEDSYIQQVKQDSCDHLGIMVDSIADINCSVTGFVTCHGINSLAPYSYSWDGNAFSSNPELYTTIPGGHTVLVKAANNCITNRSVIIGGPIPAQIDAQVNCVPGAFIPGVSSSLHINGFNEGCTITSGQITFVIPALMNFDSSSVTPDYLNGDTLIWNYSNFDFETPHFATEIFYTTDTLATIGDSLCFPLTITPLLDDYPANNERFYCFPVQNSYDPNNKFVYPSGVCVPNFIDTNTRLTYSVNFQNTGTSEAINIYLLDEIDSDLDINTLNVVGSSHPVMTEILLGNLVKFRLDNIYLVDSTTNEHDSKGYVIFELDQDSGLPNNTEILNSVGIYFDYNAPVHTNSVLNTVVDVVPGIDYTTVQLTACDSILIENEIYESTGNYLLDLSNQYGCDSLVTVDLTIKQSTSSYFNETVCDTFEIAGQVLDSSGYYEYHINNSVGCDSLIQLDLVRLNTNSTLSVTECDSVYINGNIYSTDGTYFQTLTSAFGCDSILQLDVTILASSIQELYESSCESFVFHGVTYSQSGDYYGYYLNSEGCDSIEHLQLTIIEDTQSEFFIEGLDSVNFNDQMYYSSGQYEQIIPNSTGCDSVITINITMNYSGLSIGSISNLHVYPNPTNSVIHIVSAKAENSNFVVLDARGRLQKVSAIYTKDEILIDLQHLVTGVYYIYFETGELPVIRVIKE